MHCLDELHLLDRIELDLPRAHPDSTVFTGALSAEHSSLRLDNASTPQRVH